VNYRTTALHSEYPRLFQGTGANQNARKLLSTDLINTNDNSINNALVRFSISVSPDFFTFFSIIPSPFSYSSFLLSENINKNINRNKKYKYSYKNEQIKINIYIK